MVFADLFFIYVFLPTCLIAYFIAKKIETRNIILIVFSLIFYAWGEPLWIILLIFSAAFNWFMGRQIGRFKGGDPDATNRNAKIVVAIALIVNILMLLVFKYTGFFFQTFSGIIQTEIWTPQITLPIGISFYTFQAISYILDCYWGTVEPQKRFSRFLLYISFFPQLIAGPIVRYSVIEKEIGNRTIRAQDISEGALRVCVGLAKKVIIANNLYAISNTFFGAEGGIAGLSTLGTWYTVICYSLYVYFDFSGYSDIAIGMGRMFGFHFDENFNYPFACKTISEFWQRWHISLGSFFRDYLLYVPIFGKSRKFLGLFLVWFCTGMWHGASWNFIIWGLYFGAWILFEQLLGKKRLKKWPKWVKHIYSKLIIIIGFGIFYFEDFGQLGQFFLNISGVSMFTNGSGFVDVLTWNSLINNLFLILAAMIVSMPILPKVKTFFLENKNDKIYIVGKVGSTVLCAFLLLVVSLFLVDATNNPFLYWRF